MSFDTNSFLSTETTDSTSTEYVPFPEGEFNAVVDGLDLRTPKGNTILDVNWRVDSPENEETNGKVVRQSIFLDMLESGAMDSSPGKNVQLGRLREALGQNQKGRPWSPNMMLGQVALISTKQRTGPEGQIFTDVKNVAKL